MTSTARHPNRWPLHCGGIDLGGTKIEAQLFRVEGMTLVDRRRVATPTAGFDTLLAALLGQIDWLCKVSRDPDLPIAIAAPGSTDPKTGAWHAANLPLAGRDLAAEVARAAGRPLALVNDAAAFTLSEARPDARVIVGLVLGTGIGAGLCIDGAIAPRSGGFPVEIGHIGLPAAALIRHTLPLWRCGCGKTGCFEPYVSGTGLANLAEWRLGRRVEARDLVAEKEPVMAEIVEIWSDLAGECLAAITALLAPDHIVLGGGLSKIEGVEALLQGALDQRRLAFGPAPRISKAKHGDSSGARGAARLAAGC